MISMIVAVNNKGYIGKDGIMPWHNKEDLKHFKNTTLNHNVVMGRKTYEGLPKKLNDRNIYVVSKTKTFPDVTMISDFKEFLNDIKKSKETWFIAGGGNIYDQSMSIVDEILVSVIDDDTIGDVLFPSISNDFYLSEEIPFETFKLKIYRRKLK